MTSEQFFITLNVRDDMWVIALYDAIAGNQSFVSRISMIRLNNETYLCEKKGLETSIRTFDLLISFEQTLIA